MYLLIGIVGALLALSVTAAAPGDRCCADRRRRARRLPGDADSSRTVAAGETARALDCFCAPIPR